MSVVKKVRQSGGTIIDTIFSDDGKQIKTNIDGGYIVWVPATQENFDLPVVSDRERRIRKAEYDLRKIGEQVEVLKARAQRTPLAEPEYVLDEDLLREGRRRHREEERLRKRYA